MSGEAVAIKVLHRDWESRANKNPMFKKQLEAEINVMKGTDHRNIVKLLDVTQHPATGSLCIVLEFCEGGDLEKYTVAKGGWLREAEVRPLVRHLALGLQFLVDARILHRDLKPENLLLAVDSKTRETVVKIADFGLARFLEEPFQMAETQCGTRHYMAPEIQKSNPYTYKADLWSVGVIIYRLITGKRLFNTTPSLRQLDDPLFNLFHPDVPELQNVSEECVDLLTKLLEMDPNSRIDWNGFCSHPFINIPPTAKPKSPSPQTDKMDNSHLFFDQYDLTDTSHLSLDSIPTMKNISSSISTRLDDLNGTMPTGVRFYPLQSSRMSDPKWSGDIFIREIDERQNSILNMKKLADGLVKEGKVNSAFVIYVEIMKEIKALNKELSNEKAQFIGQSPPKSTTRASLQNLNQTYEVIKENTLQLRKKIRGEEVINVMRVILENILKKGIKGAQEEKLQNWEEAAQIYNEALSCFNFLHQYLTNNGTSIDQAHLINYIKQFKNRKEFVTAKINS
uniref:Protein kinase domain-containing protein n=1 Tax=Arcella intermedia TaxID=1963864 RepID=A0A6B2L1S6_9EUKA